MDDLEKRLDSMLSETDRKVLAGTGELGYFGLAISLLRGPLAWVNIVIVVTQLVMFALFIWCAVRFFAAPDTLSALKWGLPGAVLMLTVTQMKMSLFDQMHSNRVLRRLRRIELLLARA